MGWCPPLEFIPLAEQTGLIVPIGRFVLHEACRQMQAWQGLFPTRPPMTVSVNLSARELDEPGLVGSVRAALQQTGLAPAHLVLEITESLLLVDLPGTISKLSELRALGVRLAIDDFGTGYSSLAYLENLPVDILKIDKSFVDRIGEGPSDPLTASLGESPPAGHGVGDQPARACAPPADGRRGHRAAGAGRDAAWTGLPVRPGLLLRPAADARRTGRVAAPAVRRAGLRCADAPAAGAARPRADAADQRLV